MDDISQLDEVYNKFITNLEDWSPEGITEVNLKLLQSFDLLHYHRRESHDPGLTRYFHVVETPEKITLVNEQFVVWIVPDKIENLPVTYILIALNKDSIPHLEIVFQTQGIYNSSRLVLRVLEKYLQEIHETEDLLSHYKKKVS